MAKIIHITIHILSTMLIKNRLQIMICFEKTIDFTHSETEKMQLPIQFRLDRGILLGEFLNVDGLPKPWPAEIRLIVRNRDGFSNCRPVPSISCPCHAWFYWLRSPFVASAKLPSRKLSFHFSKPSRLTPRAVLARHPTKSPPLPTAQPSPASGRRRILGENKPPLCARPSTHIMPSGQALFEVHGRPRLSLRRFGTGSGSISLYCSSVNNSNRSLLIQEAQQNNVLLQKYTVGTESIHETASRTISDSISDVHYHLVP